MLEIHNLDFSYEDGIKILKNISAEFEAGGISSILGESGSGKTTLLKCIGRFERVDSGSVVLDGKSIYDYTEKEFRMKIGIVFQDLNLFPHMSVIDNMTLAPEKVLGRDSAETGKLADEILRRLGIAEIADRFPAQISGGQAQRVAIARALMLKPGYLLLDEPTAALDVNTTEEFGKWLEQLKDITTFILVTHDVQFASDISTYGVLLEGGEITARGGMSEVLESMTGKTGLKKNA